MSRAGPGPPGRQPLAWPAWPAWHSEVPAPRCWCHLGFPWLFLSDWERGPCPPPGAGGLCSLAPVPGGRLPRRCKPRYCPVCPRSPCTRPICSLEELTEACPDRGGYRRACLSPQSPHPHPPGDLQESQDQHPEVCVLGASWGVDKGKGDGRRDVDEIREGTREGSCFCPYGAASKVSWFYLFILLKEEGNRHLPSTNCVRCCAVNFRGLERHQADNGSVLLVAVRK